MKAQKRRWTRSAREVQCAVRVMTIAQVQGDSTREPLGSRRGESGGQSSEAHVNPIKLPFKYDALGPSLCCAVHFGWPIEQTSWCQAELAPRSAGAKECWRC